MRRLLPFVLFLPLLAACNRGGSGTQPPTDNPTPTPGASSDGWSWINDTAGGFKVEMAGTPTRIEQTVDHFPQCGSVNCVVYSVKNADASFLLNFWDLDTPQASNVPIDGLINTLRATFGSGDVTVGSDQNVKLKSGHAGRECNYNRPSGTLTVRWVTNNRRLYMLTYAGKTDDRASHQTATARFMNSFELTGAAPAPVATQWTDYTDPDGRYQAKFLGTPKRQQIPLPHPKLGQLAFDVCETKEAGQSMSVIEITVTPPAGATVTDEQVVNELRDAHVRRTNGQIVNERAVTVQGLNGREVVVATARQGNATLRFIPFDGKYYMLGAQGLSGTPPAEDTARFLDSFRFRSVDWQNFSPAGGRFSIRFKSTPQKGANALPGPRGQVQETVFSNATDSATFLASYADFDGAEGQGATMDQIVGFLRDVAVRNSGGRVVSEQPVQLGIAGGREVVLELPNRVTVRFRWLAHVRRVYSIGVIGKQPGALPAEDVTRFIDSFKITQ